MKNLELQPDRDLLILAAMAAGIGPVLCYESQRNCLRVGTRDSYRLWRPLTCSADNQLLLAQLGGSVSIEGGTATAEIMRGAHQASITAQDPVSAIRRAVLVVAAKLGCELARGATA